MEDQNTHFCLPKSQNMMPVYHRTEQGHFFFSLYIKASWFSRTTWCSSTIWSLKTGKFFLLPLICSRWIVTLNTKIFECEGTGCKRERSTTFKGHKCLLSTGSVVIHLAGCLPAHPIPRWSDLSAWFIEKCIACNGYFILKKPRETWSVGSNKNPCPFHLKTMSGFLQFTVAVLPTGMIFNITVS